MGMRACGHACMQVCVSVRLFVCTKESMEVSGMCAYASMKERTYMHIHMYVSVFALIYVCMHMSQYVRMFVRMCANIHICMYENVYIYIYFNLYICTHTHTYVYIYIYIYRNIHI